MSLLLSYLENYYPSDNENASERRGTLNDATESSVMDLQTILQGEPRSAIKLPDPKLMAARSSSWETSTLQSYNQNDVF